jgi:large subunit ribosomal protein L23
MRDYMWNVYGIHCRGVRSYIQMQKLRQDKPGAKRPKPRQWFRPRSVKKMLIEMERPFVWPEVPDLDKWDKKTHDAAQKEREENEEMFSPDARKKPTKERVSIKGQARPLLRARARREFDQSEEGRALRERLKARRKEAEVEEEEGEWVDDGEAVEVETDVDVSKVPRS